MQPQQIHDLFSVHMLNDQGKRKAIELAEVFSALLYQLDVILPVNYERSIRDKLQEACFLAKRSMAEQPENQA